jgi:acyl-[acyl-carrier-protein]-phospholipid O-acyltransferase / long-chain-fatty-acid--[acyl-carrier-protein] ligase
MLRRVAVRSDLLSLLSTRTFSSFFATQFLGAFNDNLFKTALSLLIAFHVTQQAESESSILVNLAAILFILPFFILSPRAGSLADSFDKVTLIRRLKLLEILIMCLGGLGFYLGNTWFLLAVLFFMGAQSTFFGPLKYSYLPSVLDREQLVSANALIQASTFIAIILGMILAGVLFSYSDEHFLIVSGSTVFFALLGYVSSRLMRGEQITTMSEITAKEGFISLLGISRSNRLVWQAILGISWFWMVGATYITQLPNFVRFYVYANEQVFLICLGLFAVGIGVGAIICSLIKPTRLGQYSVAIGLIGLFVSGLLVSQYSSPPTETLRGLVELGQGADVVLIISLLLLGVSGGLYIVPLYTVLQIQSLDSQRSRMVAMNNIMNALYMVVSALIALGLFAAGLSISELFVLLACLNVSMLVYFGKSNLLFLSDVKQLYQG